MNYYRTHILLAILAALPVVAISANEPTPATSFAFEGLTWGATEAQVREVFGGKVLKMTCTDKEKESQARRPNARLCGGLTVDEYTIDGISFLAVFSMGGRDATLNAVYLDRVATVTNDQIKSGEDAEFRYNRVKNELSKRYGKPSSESPKSRSKVGLAALHSEWHVEGTVVSLTDMIIPDRRGQMYYLKVVYKPSGEANKPLPGGS